MPSREISTKDIILHAFRDGKKVFIPYIHASQHSKSKTMDMLRLRDEDDLNSLQPDAWGIPSLSAESASNRENALGGIGCLEEEGEPVAESSSLDLIFMPAMAFDKFHNRLGHGKGFYDRYLTQCKQLLLAKHQNLEMPHLGLYSLTRLFDNSDKFIVGLALREQLLPEGDTLPTTDEDWKVDTVISADS